MARILVVYKEFPAPSVGHAGGRAVFLLLKALRRRGHRIHLVARLRREEAALVDEMAPFCEEIVTTPHHQALPGLRAWAWLRSYLLLRRAAADALRRVRPDWLHVELTQTAACLLGLRRPFSSLRLLDVNWFMLEQRAAAASGLRRWAERAAGWAFRWFEPWLYRRYDVIAAISEGDRQLLEPRCWPRPVLILPLVPAQAVQADVAPAVERGPNVLFVGAMYRTFNVQGVQWFLETIWPLVRERVPAARFYVVGYAPPPEIQAHHDGERVFVTGAVEDVAPWYRAAAVLVSPMRVAGGLLQKVVDALAAGVPVVATTVSNHGLGATPGEHLLLADEPAAFAEAVVRLLNEPAERERLARAGQQFIHARYDLEEAVDRFEALATRLLAAARG